MSENSNVYKKPYTTTYIDLTVFHYIFQYRCYPINSKSLNLKQQKIFKFCKGHQIVSSARKMEICQSRNDNIHTIQKNSLCGVDSS